MSERIESCVCLKVYFRSLNNTKTNIIWKSVFAIYLSIHMQYVSIHFKFSTQTKIVFVLNQNSIKPRVSKS